MANQEHLEILKKGVPAWNEWTTQNPGIKPDLSEADLRKADLREANFRKVNLRGADLIGANLRKVNLRGADLSGVDLSGVDLGRLNLMEADLSEANLSVANLSVANLMEAILVGTNLRGANLSGAFLSGAFLTGAFLTGADLSGADLNRANLRGANFSGTDLSGADFANSAMGATSIGNVDLSGVKGLETVVHFGPSSIGIDTIYRSQGNIPEVFLRGMGVPESFMVYMKSLTANPVEFYSCFISYSSKNTDFAERLYADLQAKGVRCWFARHDMQAGKKVHEQIDEAIRVHERLLLILSLDSMDSEWVKTEIAKARKREVQQKRKVLFPLGLVPFQVIQDWECFDADMGKDSAREIREYFIPDFSNWKDHDAYQKAFEQLMRDLKAEDSPNDKVHRSGNPSR